MPTLRKESVTYHDVDEASDGQRLDNFLIKVCKGVPKSHLYRVVRSGEVRVNGRRCTADMRLQLSDRVRIPPLRVAEKPSENVATGSIATALRQIDLPVLFEDDRLLIVNKPPGVAVHGGSGISGGVVEILRLQRPDAPFLELAHRLDKETSGVLVLAKRRSSLRRLHDYFRHGTLDKRYLVMVSGAWTQGVAKVRVGLRKTIDDRGEKRVLVDENGQDSYTIFTPLAVGRRFSLLEAWIKTGRTHQIRVQLAHLGHPVLGDERYGDFSLNRKLRGEGLKRMFLHAWTLSMDHPETKESLRFVARLPAELKAFFGASELAERRIDVEAL